MGAKECIIWRSRYFHGRGEFGKGPPIAKYRDTAVSSTKTGESIEMPG